MNQEIIKKFIEIKKLIMKELIIGNNVNENDILNGIDIILECIADKEILENGKSEKWYKYFGLHKQIMQSK